MDCPPQYSIPQKGALSLGNVMKRLDAVESALTICRSRLEAIRNLPIPLDPDSPVQ